MAFHPERTATRNFQVKGWLRQPLLAIAFAIALGNPALADTYHVDDDGQDLPIGCQWEYDTIQEAVDDASAGDRIYVYAGTYQYSGSASGSNGNGGISAMPWAPVVFIDKPLWLIAIDSSGDVIIDGENSRRCLTLLGEDRDVTTASLLIQGFKIINGRAQAGLGINPEHGGGIYAEGYVNIQFCDISNCRSDGNGGGIAVFNPKPTEAATDLNHHPFTYASLDSCTVQHCTAFGDGGGIWNYESTLYMNNSISPNGETGSSAINQNSSNARGGGIAVQCVTRPSNGSVTSLDDVDIRSNYANGDGGGVFAEGMGGEMPTANSYSTAIPSSLYFSHVNILSNQNRAGDGGGVCLFNALMHYDNLKLADNVANSFGGSGGNGGGLAANSSFLMPRNSFYTTYDTLVCLNNTATARGGGVFAFDSDIDLIVAHFEGNEADGKGGAVAAISCGQVDFTDSTFDGNDGRLAGALYLKYSPGTFDHCSILNNRGWLNGGWNGAAVVIDGASADLTSRDSNFWQNSMKHIKLKNDGSFTNDGGNIVSPTAVP